MTEKLSMYIVDNILYKGETIDQDQKDIMTFGVTRILEDIPKFIIVTVLCYFLNILKEAGIVLIITAIYKIFIGGAHARTNLECLFFSIIYFILPVLTAIYIPVSIVAQYILIIFTIMFSLYVIITKAPADTEEIPIINKKRRKLLKNIAFISLLMIIIYVIFFSNNIIYSNIILYTMIIINFYTTKPMYKLLKCKHGYESEEYKDLY
ncbi:MAG: accessory gene regulator B family protein [Clostridia bacterium]